MLRYVSQRIPGQKTAGGLLQWPNIILVSILPVFNGFLYSSFKLKSIPKRRPAILITMKFHGHDSLCLEIVSRDRSANRCGKQLWNSKDGCFAVACNTHSLVIEIQIRYNVPDQGPQGTLTGWSPIAATLLLQLSPVFSLSYSLKNLNIQGIG